MSKRPTIRDVAAEAGVSIATVSKYINATQRFTAGVERKIQSAIEQLDYRSNPLARSMITGKTGAVGLAILDISNPHFTSLVKGAHRIAVEQGYNLLLVDTEESLAREKELLGALSRRVDGLIVSTRVPDDQLAAFLAFGKPVVLSGRPGPTGVPSIGVDVYAAGTMIGELLAKQGHRRIAYIGFAPAYPDRERMRALSDCFARHNLPLTRYEIARPTLAEGERICASIVLGKDRPDAVVCYNDLVAIGFMGIAKSLGVSIPHDMSVVGVDNIPFGAFSDPALTTVDIQSEHHGEEAMRLLIRQIAGTNPPDIGFAPLEPHFVLRDSTAPRVAARVAALQ